MNNITPFLQLFSDEAAMPRQGFIENLEKQFYKKAGIKSRRIGKNNGTLLGGMAIMLIVAGALSLVLLPKRDMRDPTKNSVIETVVNNSWQGAGSFADSQKPATQSTDKPAQNTKPTQQAPTTTQTPTQQAAVPNNQGSSSPVTPAQLTGFTAEYWDTPTEVAGGPNMPVGAPDHTSTAATINFDWSTGSPHAATINSDNFVARFTKTSADIKGTYKVTYRSDNGIRMFVDETAVFDKWNQPSSEGVAYFTTDSSVPVSTITIEYYELDGPANISVEIVKL